jgi:dienelactone hydrolase
MWLTSLALLSAEACSRSVDVPGSGATTPAVADPAEKARVVVRWMSGGDFASVRKEYSEELARALPGDKLEMHWRDLVQRYGPFREMRRERQEKRAGHDVIIVTCHFDKGDVDVRMAFDGRRRLDGILFQQSRPAAEPKAPPYARPDSYTESEVTVGSSEWPLPGTLAVPRGDGPFRAVVLLAGSGPQDRDETIGPNKPLRDLAWGLASQGIAVLRYDKRTCAHGAELVRSKANVTLKEEVVDDALAAVGLLRGRKEIDAARVFVLGHSLGAVAAPEVGRRDPRLAGLVLMAGNTRPLADCVLEQVTYLASLKGSLSNAERQELDKFKNQIARLQNLKPSAAGAGDEVILGAPVSYWLALRQYDQAATAAKLAQPVFVLQGERDYQVSMADFAGWKKALRGKANATFKGYPRLNHLFMEGKGKSQPAEYDQAGNVAAEVVNDVAAWIKQH